MSNDDKHGDEFDRLKAQKDAILHGMREVIRKAIDAYDYTTTPHLRDSGVLANHIFEALSAPSHVVPATGEGYIGHVADKCDRITWRGRYYHLPDDVLPSAVGKYTPPSSVVPPIICHVCRHYAGGCQTPEKCRAEHEAHIAARSSTRPKTYRHCVHCKQWADGPLACCDKYDGKTYEVIKEEPVAVSAIAPSTRAEQAEKRLLWLVQNIDPVELEAVVGGPCVTIGEAITRIAEKSGTSDGGGA